jgi:hypothetical protein
MKKLFVLFISAALFSCSGSDDSPVVEDQSNSGFSTFKVEFSKNGNVDEWFEELDFRTSVNGWNISNVDAVSDGDLEGSEIKQTFTIESKSKINELIINYFATPHFDGTTYLDDSEPTFLNVSFKVYENGKLIDTKTLSLDGEVRATKDFEYKYIVD